MSILGVRYLISFSRGDGKKMSCLVILNHVTVSVPFFFCFVLILHFLFILFPF